MNTKTEALSTRIRFRLKTQLFLSVFKKINVHTRTGKRRFPKVPFWRASSKSFVFGDRFIVYVRFQKIRIRVDVASVHACCTRQEIEREMRHTFRHSRGVGTK